MYSNSIIEKATFNRVYYYELVRLLIEAYLDVDFHSSLSLISSAPPILVKLRYSPYW